MTRALDGLLGLWSTSELATQINCSATEVSRWRGGYRRPQPKRIRQIGDALAALRVAPGQPTNADIATARREVAEAVAADAASRRPDHHR
jgi:transcriptional regulator with XRE-family HTH domain